MPQDIVHRTTTSPRDQVFEVTTPLSSRLLFRKPRYLEGSDFLRHLPFLFWLTDMVRPRSFVQLGDLDAVPYFGVCQAMDRLDLESRCTGIRLDGAVPEAVERYNDDTYGEFSALRSATVEAAPGGMADKSVDLLLVDRVPDEALIAALMRSWPRRLSSRAVVALHGTRGEGYMSGPALEFIENIRATYPTFTLEGGAGLTVVLYGASRNDRLQRLAELKPGHSGFSEARMVFRRLGDTSHFEWESRRAGGAEKAEAGRAQAAESRLAEAEAGLKEMTEAFEERASQAAAAQARVYRLETEAEEARARAEAAETGLEEMEARAAALESDRAALARDLKEKTAAAAELTRTRAALEESQRARDLAQARAEKAEKQAEEARLSEHRARGEIRQELAAAQRALEEEREAFRTLDEEADALKQALEAAEAALAEERQAHAALREEAEQEARLKLAEEISAKDARIAELERDPSGGQWEERLAKLTGQMALLTRELEKEQELRLLQGEDLSEARARAAEAEEDSAAARAHAEEMERLNQELMNSTFWRMTGPARKVVNTLRGQ